VKPRRTCISSTGPLAS